MSSAKAKAAWRGVVAAALVGLLARSTVAETWRVKREVRAGSMPWSVTVSRDGGALWVAMVGLKDRDNVWRYDAETLDVTAMSSFPGHAVEAELVADGARLWVTNSRKDRLMELDADTLAVERSIKTDRVPKDLDLSPDGRTAYIANYGAGTLSAIRLSDGRASHIATGRHARGASVSPDGREVYVMNFGAGTVSVVDTARFAVSARIVACKNPRHGVVVGPVLLVTCYGSADVVVIDRASRKVTRSIGVGAGPKTIALAPDASFAVTANEKGNSISIIDLATYAVSNIPLPARKPCGVAIAPDGKRIYVTARGSHRLLELTR